MGRHPEPEARDLVAPGLARVSATGFLAALSMTVAALSMTLPLTTRVAHADATPTQIVLLYMPGVSTTGTTAATGVAELVLQEGEVRISVTGLPRLDGNDQYAAWVLDTDATRFFRLGTFNTAQSTGAVHFEQVLPEAIPTAHWNMVLLTLEDSLNPDHPSARHSLAGMFPPSGSDLVPELLPNTGGADDVSPLSSGRTAEWLSKLGLPSLTLTLGAGAGYALGRHRP